MDKKEASTVGNPNPDTPLDMLRRVLAVAEIVAKSMPPVPSKAPEMDEKPQKV